MFGFGKKNNKDKAKADSLESPTPTESSAQTDADLGTTEDANEQLIESTAAQEPDSADVMAVATGVPPEASDQPEKKGFWRRLRSGLSRTRESFSSGVANVFLGKKNIDDDVLEELETCLLTADVGVAATQEIISDLTARVARKQLGDIAQLMRALKENLLAIVGPHAQPLVIGDARPYVIMMVGINGAGKTTTIGKLAKQFQAQGHSVMLAAGDTFRAAAVEQLQAWGERNNVPVIAQARAADPASVAYDALEAARARKADILIVDTAGRLHTQINLMDELKKIKRVMGKLESSAPHETLLVVDSGIGQNALVQAKQFDEALGLNGIVLTKLDGTAKGGIVFAIAKQMKLPIRYVGVGEGVDDLQPFDAQQFVNALVPMETDAEDPA